MSVMDEPRLLTQKYCDLTGATYGLAEPYFMAAYLAGVAASPQLEARTKHSGHPDQSVHDPHGGRGEGRESRGRRFASEGGEQAEIDAARDWGDSRYAGWQSSSLDGMEQEAIRDYSQVDYRRINGELRGNPYGNPDALEMRKIQEDIANLNSAIGRASVPEDVIVYRTLDRKVLGSMDPDSLVGAQFTDQGFVSTSLSPRVSTRLFAHGEAPGSKYVMEIAVPKGHQGAYLDSSAAYKAEVELTLQQGSQFEVIGYREEGGYTYLEVNHLGP